MVLPYNNVEKLKCIRIWMRGKRTWKQLLQLHSTDDWQAKGRAAIGGGCGGVKHSPRRGGDRAPSFLPSFRPSACCCCFAGCSRPPCARPFLSSHTAYSSPCQSTGRHRTEAEAHTRSSHGAAPDWPIQKTHSFAIWWRNASGRGRWLGSGWHPNPGAVGCRVGLVASDWAAIWEADHELVTFACMLCLECLGMCCSELWSWLSECVFELQKEDFFWFCSVGGFGGASERERERQRGKETKRRGEEWVPVPPPGRGWGEEEGHGRPPRPSQLQRSGFRRNSRRSALIRPRIAPQGPRATTSTSGCRPSWDPAVCLYVCLSPCVLHSSPPLPSFRSKLWIIHYVAACQRIHLKKHFTWFLWDHHVAECERIHLKKCFT